MGTSSTNRTQVGGNEVPRSGAGQKLDLLDTADLDSRRPTAANQLPGRAARAEGSLAPKAQIAQAEPAGLLII